MALKRKGDNVIITLQEPSLRDSSFRRFRIDLKSRPKSQLTNQNNGTIIIEDLTQTKI